MNSDTINKFDLTEIIGKLKEWKVYPFKFSNGGKEIISEDPNGNNFFSEFFNIKNFETWSYNKYPNEKKYCISIDDFKNALALKTGENPDTVLWRLASVFALQKIFDRFSISRESSYEKMNESLISGKALVMDDKIFEILISQKVPRDDNFGWIDLAANDPKNDAWKDLSMTIRLLAGCSRNNLVMDDDMRCILRRCLAIFWKGAPGFGLNDIISIKGGNFKKKKEEIIDATFKFKPQFEIPYYRDFAMWKLLESENQDDNLKDLIICTRSLFVENLNTNNPAELAICLIKKRIAENEMEGLNYEHFYNLNFSSFPVQDYNLFLFVLHLDHLANGRWSNEAESHRLRAIESASACGEWLPAFTPWILRAYSKFILDELIKIFSTLATEELLDRLEDITDDLKERYTQPASAADLILRKCGRKQKIESSIEIIERNLIGPIEPIRGQTWLNDLNIESLLYESIRQAESEFSRYYFKYWKEHEDYLLRDLFDNHIRIKFLEGIEKANVQALRPNDRWEIQYSKLQPLEEKSSGADIALFVEVYSQRRIIFRRLCLIQVKKMKRSKTRFTSTWRIDPEQVTNLLKITDYSFFLLLTPEIISAQQRILPADTVRGILNVIDNKESLVDSLAAPPSHSLAQFLVYDLLGGWQGTVKKELTDWIDKRDGAAPRFILDIKLSRGESKQH